MSDKEKYGWNHDMICDSTSYYRMLGYNVAFSTSTKSEELFLREKYKETLKKVLYSIYENTEKS